MSDTYYFDRPAARLGRACVEHPDVYPQVKEPLFVDAAGNRFNAIICYCDGRRHVLARIHRDTTEDALMLWTCPESAPINAPGVTNTGPVRVVKHPPAALHLPRVESDPHTTRIASCPRCRRGWILSQRVGWVAVLLTASDAPGRGRIVE